MRKSRKSSYLSEWTTIFRSRKLLVAVTAIAFVPLMYTAMFLWAFWDPYGKLDALPVAVVNLDRCRA